MDIKGTQTEKNLQTALAGESMARNKYTYYSMAAKKEGLDEIADAFERMASNEMMHAKFWFEALNGTSEDTVKNLWEAARGEFSEWDSMYPSFAAKAREEGQDELAAMFERVAGIEKAHEKQFMMLLKQLKQSKSTATPVQSASAVKTELKVKYRCQFCGAVYDARPDVCEVCSAIGAFETFEDEV